MDRGIGRYGHDHIHVPEDLAGTSQEMRSHEKYGRFDDQPLIDQDRAFKGFQSNLRAGILSEGLASDSVNARIENGCYETRKGQAVEYASGAGKQGYSSCRFINPLATTTPDPAVATAGQSSLTIYDPSAGATEVPYQSGQTATSDAELVEAFGSLFLFRGKGATLPATLPFTLGEYPLMYEGVSPSAGGIVKMPLAIVVCQIYPSGGACRVDLAPIESKSETWTFSGADELTGSVGGSSTGHQFVDGDTVKLSGTTSYNGVHEVKVVDYNTIELVGASAPGAVQDRNAQAIGWSESYNLPPADFAVATASRLAFVNGPDQILFSDAFAPSVVNPYFNRVLINEGTGDYITALLPVQDDSLLVFKRNSIYLVTNTSSLGDDLRVIEITRQLGCVSRGTVQEIGDLVFFLSDSGVYAIEAGIRDRTSVATPMRALEIISTPTSEPIQDKIKAIDFSKADQFVSCFYDNRYMLGVVSQGASEIDQVLVFNQIYKQWESVDSLPTAQQSLGFVTIPKAGINRMFITSKNNHVMRYDDLADNTDVYRNSSAVEVTDRFSFELTTRDYGFSDFNQKRYIRTGIEYQALNATSMNVTSRITNPDHTNSAFYVRAHASAEGVGAGVKIKKQGQYLGLIIKNMDASGSSVGRLKIEAVGVEANISGRQTRREI